MDTELQRKGYDVARNTKSGITQDLRTCGELSGFRAISRGLRPQEIVQLRKSYYSCRLAIVGNWYRFF
jgi:hypothetical protein